ncbi:MAG: HAMP domain-containing histidine kinase [Nitrospinae bacterium]|nr:HAMP domain-containing histidine kinase [Nitrospinota bacterium]
MKDLREHVREFLSPKDLKGKLLLSHLSVTVIGLAGLLIAFIGLMVLRGALTEFSGETAPKAQAAMTALSGVNRSLGGLRLSVTEEGLRQDRLDAWEKDIWPSMLKLRSMSSGEEAELVGKIISALRELEATQWWLEDLAHTPGNEPAAMILASRVKPIYETALSSITGMDNQGGARLRGRLLELKAALRDSFLELHDFAATGDEAVGAEISIRIKKALDLTDETLTAESSGGFSTALDRLKRDVEAYARFAGETMTERRKPGWNLARELMTLKVFPQTSVTAKELSNLVAAYQGEMETKARIASIMGNVVIVILALIIAGMTMVAIRLSRHNASRITRPVAALLSATQNFSAGMAEEDLPISGDDEISELTAAFNEMRHTFRAKEKALTERTAELEKAGREMESFIYSVSHDLKVPMITINGMTSLIQKELGENASGDIKLFFGHIHDAATMMARLLEDLAEISRVGRMDTRPELVNIDRIVTQVMAEATALARERKINFRIPSGIPPAWANGKRVYQIFSNLVSNAVKFMPPAEANPVVEIGVSGALEGYTGYFVRDNGEGIDPKHHEKIFMLFQRLHGRQIEGTGMGLAFVKKAVENMGGHVRLESAPGMGATFYFTLPSASQEAERDKSDI